MQFLVQGYPAYAYTGGRAYEPKAPAIVFVHGAALDHSVWQWQSRYFAHHGYTVLALDLPAHGRSPGLARTSIEAMADWVALFIEAAGLERAHVVGQSMGSLVALDVALRHRQRVDRLALVATAIPMAVNDAFLAAARDDSPVGFEMESTWGHARNSALTQSPVPGIFLAARAIGSWRGRCRVCSMRISPPAMHTSLRWTRCASSTCRRSSSAARATR
jgi:pimeloyl-ACP methyl ester carboxylesterase